MKSVSTFYGLGTEGHVLSRSYCIDKSITNVELNPVIFASLKDCSEYPTADSAPQPVFPAEGGHDGVHGQVAEPLLGRNGVRDD